MATGTSEKVDLDVDLDAEIACEIEQITQEFECEGDAATIRFSFLHDDDTVCQTFLLSHQCAMRLLMLLGELGDYVTQHGVRTICTAHGQEFLGETILRWLR